MTLMTNMPRYQCHKVVQAAKITAVDRVERKIEIAHGGPDGVITASGWIHCTGDWFLRHEPKVGGYFVLYDDGYTSFSPAEAFEKGYTLIPHEG